MDPTRRRASGPHAPSHWPPTERGGRRCRGIPVRATGWRDRADDDRRGARAALRRPSNRLPPEGSRGLRPRGDRRIARHLHRQLRSKTPSCAASAPRASARFPMSMLLRGFHPSFDALSAHADLSDIDGGRTRVGRHVARCARCADLVEDIRRLGDSTRAAVIPGVPAGLWTRIEVLLKEPSSPASATPGHAGAAVARSPSGPPPIPQRRTPAYGSVARLGVGLSIAAGTALAAVLLATGPRRDLRASAPSRL